MNVRCGPMYKGGVRMEIDGSKLKRIGKGYSFSTDQIRYMQELLDGGYRLKDICEHTGNDPTNLSRSIKKAMKRINESLKEER